jgi:acyl-coenzyme A synthetase/AMP-(fatty) acid ligase
MPSRPPALLHELLDDAAEVHGERPAIVTDDGALSYRELAAGSRRVACWLCEQGVRPGDRIATLLPNWLAVPLVAFAASRVGAIFAVLEPGLKTYGLERVLTDCEPALLLTEAGRSVPHVAGMRIHTVEPSAERLLATAGGSAEADLGTGAPAPDESVCLIYTSGTTSAPKAVESTHAQMLFAVAAIQAELGIRPDDVVGDFLPLAFDYGLYQLLLCCHAGATLALGDRLHVGPAFLGHLRRRGVTGLPMVPTMAALLVRLGRRDPRSLPPLRFVTNTGAHLSPALIEALGELLPQTLVYSMYGLTECKRVAILPPAELERRPTSVGRPLPGTRCEIVDEAGAPLPTGAEGELVVYGPHVMRGYWRAPELTRARYRQTPSGRALYTGDRCSLDADGYLYFHGRSDEIYKHRDRRVSTAEVEAAALDVPGVLEAVVVPPHGERGPVLFVTGELATATVEQELRERLERVKLPERVVQLQRLPLRPTGKPDRAALTAQADALDAPVV